jgi:hypothetical protein
VKPRLSLFKTCSGHRRYLLQLAVLLKVPKKSSGLRSNKGQLHDLLRHLVGGLVVVVELRDSTEAVGVPVVDDLHDEVGGHLAGRVRTPHSETEDGALDADRGDSTLLPVDNCPGSLGPPSLNASVGDPKDLGSAV